MIPSDLVRTVASTTSSVSSGIEADLQQAATGMGGQFQVDLEVLYGYYGRLTTLYAHVEQLISECGASDNAPSGPASRITGVAAAEKATAESWNGSISMQSTLRSILSDIGTHITNLRLSYLAYVKADTDGAQRLTAAAHPELVNVDPTSTTTGRPDATPDKAAGTSGAKPSGW